MKFNITKKQWLEAGQKAGWIKLAGNWAHVQEHNSGINAKRRRVRAITQYLQNVLTLDTANPNIDVQIPEGGIDTELLAEAKQIATSAIPKLQEIDKCMAGGYMDSGYAYDDADPRNRMIDRDDDQSREKWGDFGGTLEQRIQEETARTVRENVCQQTLADIESELDLFFTRDTAIQIGLGEDGGLVYTLEEWRVNEMDADMYGNDD